MKTYQSWKQHSWPLCST